MHLAPAAKHSRALFRTPPPAPAVAAIPNRYTPEILTRFQNRPPGLVRDHYPPNGAKPGVPEPLLDLLT